MQQMPEVPDGFACLCIISVKGMIRSINDHWSLSDHCGCDCNVVIFDSLFIRLFCGIVMVLPPSSLPSCTMYAVSRKKRPVAFS